MDLAIEWQPKRSRDISISQFRKYIRPGSEALGCRGGVGGGGGGGAAKLDDAVPFSLTK